MTTSFQLTKEQRETFAARGLVRFDKMLPLERITRARQAVERAFEPLGWWRDGAWRFEERTKPRYPDKGFKSKQLGNKHNETIALLDEPALIDAADALLEGRAFDRSIYRRPQVLVTLPNADEWKAPTGWHVDAPRVESGQSMGVQMFTFLDVVEPGGGGTCVIAGSHRLLNDRGAMRNRDIALGLREHKFFQEIYAGAPSSLRGMAGEVPVELVELTGAPGDVWFMDLRILHTGAPNALARPRMMATHRFIRTDMLAEFAAAFGWEEEA
jgi:hypothetical protein